MNADLKRLGAHAGFLNLALALALDISGLVGSKGRLW